MLRCSFCWLYPSFFEYLLEHILHLCTLAFLCHVILTELPRSLYFWMEFSLLKLRLRLLFWIILVPHTVFWSFYLSIYMFISKSECQAVLWCFGSDTSCGVEKTSKSTNQQNKYRELQTLCPTILHSSLGWIKVC